jgi:hypothetical protein
VEGDEQTIYNGGLREWRGVSGRARESSEYVKENDGRRKGCCVVAAAAHQLLLLFCYPPIPPTLAQLTGIQRAKDAVLSGTNLSLVVSRAFFNDSSHVHVPKCSCWVGEEGRRGGGEEGMVKRRETS